MANLFANSGYWKDIQNAVNLAVKGEINYINIPTGISNFINVGESWASSRVIIPADKLPLNIFGAPTIRDVYDQVVDWGTVLIMPWEMPTTGPDDNPAWFEVYDGSGTVNKSFRFSDIKLVGWRYYDFIANGEPNWTIPYNPNNPGDRGSTTMYTGLYLYNSPYNTPNQTVGIQDYRVDHCCFQDLGGSAIWLGPKETVYNHHIICGVVDHNRIVNSYGDPGRLGSSDYQYRTIGYGIGLRRWANDEWDPLLGNIAGHYLNYTTFIEDNYLSRWRHDICVNDGLHIVVRNNTFDKDYAVGTVDAHGSYATGPPDDPDRTYAVGSRLMEIYNNVFKNPTIGVWDPEAWCINVRGGAALISNNTVSGHTSFVWLNEEDGAINYQPKCKTDNVFIWNNNQGGATTIGYDGRYLGGSYYLRMPNITQDGFEYTLYTYPHPIVQGTPYHNVNIGSSPNNVPFIIKKIKGF